GFTPDFVEIYREYLAEIPLLFIELRNKIRSNDANQVSRIAHQIKGSSANFGFIGVSQPTAKLEQEAKSGSLANAFLFLGEAENGFALAVSEVRARQSV
ncbi:MAG: Hpt domain-containing protein, partial [Terrimicrobiaceae bacterium]